MYAEKQCGCATSVGIVTVARSVCSTEHPADWPRRLVKTLRVLRSEQGLLHVWNPAFRVWIILPLSDLPYMSQSQTDDAILQYSTTSADNAFLATRASSCDLDPPLGPM